MMTTLRNFTISTEATLVTESCYDCGVLFAFPEELHRVLLRERTGRQFYCPNGHAQYYLGEGDKERIARLERELSRAKDRSTALSAEVDQANTRAVLSERARQRIERRTSNGVCQHCHRTFVNVQRHQRSKHPELVVQT